MSTHNTQWQTDGHTLALLSVFDANQDDLTHYRQRRLSAAQQERILVTQRKALLWQGGRAITFAVVMAGIAMGWLYAGVEGLTALLAVAALVGFPLLAISTSRTLWKQYTKLKTQTVVSYLEGPAEPIERHGHPAHFYGVKIRGHLFHLTSGQHAVLQAHRAYRVYYLPVQAHLPLAIEPATS